MLRLAIKIAEIMFYFLRESIFMNIGKLILGAILIAIIPGHWFLGGMAISALTGISGLLIGALWLGLLIGGIVLIYQGVTQE